MGGKQSKITDQDKYEPPSPPSRAVIATARPFQLTRENSRAILDMKIQRDRLHQYQRRITVLTDKETDIAKQMLAKGDKKRALLALRRKKYQESLLTKTDAQLEQLERLTASVEFAQIQKDVVFGLQQGTKVLSEIHAEMGGIEHVEKLMGETADAIAYQNEISEMLGSRITAADEEEVDEELAALEAEMSGVNQKLPTVPSAQLPVSERPAEQEEAQENRPERQAMLAA
ncbi:hypothetical protein N5P37_006976 [Trichoderma harzianum]|uniref:Charged multivesicular body protein 6 n=1 Tax=Trichoderma harzianum CBS 226.95 TaxID=983964 RepID=A0A2T4AJQ2_TRIHA|nr:hypothetical protein M431DRAFT_478904 [Trichoderma harzianum CBS 226.95]KAK0759900.1 hypothetical protein N5P37_006976 [Trichoderma harzianum]PTB57277.1 hypothetical protein M431DRAFT_478904 [Trichoderma harzianum CBS 226.95]